MKRPISVNRRKLLFGGALLLLTYPLLRFIGFTVPKKPVKIRVNRSVPAMSGVLSENEFVLFDRGGKSWALSRRCTHLGCTVNYHEQSDFLECPCHQSRFKTDGSVLHGPATRSLSLYSVEKLADGAGYVVTIAG